MFFRSSFPQKKRKKVASSVLFFRAMGIRENQGGRPSEKKEGDFSRRNAKRREGACCHLALRPSSPFFPAGSTKRKRFCHRQEEFSPRSAANPLSLRFIGCHLAAERGTCQEKKKGGEGGLPTLPFFFLCRGGGDEKDKI